VERRMSKRGLNANIKLLWKPFPYFFAGGTMRTRETTSRKVR